MINTLYPLGVFRKNSKHKRNFFKKRLSGFAAACVRVHRTPGSAFHFLVVPACDFWPTLMGANEGDVS